MLLAPDAAKRLRAVAKIAANEGAIAAYRSLGHENRIKGLGPAFGTKFIAFCQPEAVLPAALIHDELVTAWLEANGRADLRASTWAPRKYEAYLAQMGAWANGTARHSPRRSSTSSSRTRPTGAPATNGHLRLVFGQPTETLPHPAGAGALWRPRAESRGTRMAGAARMPRPAPPAEARKLGPAGRAVARRTEARADLHLRRPDVRAMKGVVTLGITILTPEAIYQSADQILVGGGGRLADPSGKNLTLQYLSWTGYITYAGVGRVGATHTSAIAKRWFAGQSDLTFDQVVEILRIKGGDWLDRVARGHPHTFVLAGFVDGIATCAVISNHQRWHGAPLEPRTRDLVVSAVRATGVPEVVVIGQRQAVHRPDRRILRDLARDHETIRDGYARHSRQSANKQLSESRDSSPESASPSRWTATGRARCIPRARSSQSPKS